jgi:hypothetical protein
MDIWILTASADYDSCLNVSKPSTLLLLMNVVSAAGDRKFCFRNLRLATRGTGISPKKHRAISGFFKIC